ncbi:hypothetical protein KEJ49_06455 [Candidatus Bathyarchaeota archaeon]|nr:hypothetical protein [Candidatus Bathyarchaeota archaeon]
MSRPCASTRMIKSSPWKRGGAGGMGGREMDFEKVKGLERISRNREI